MATFALPAETRVSPNLFLGAASPLWGYYATAAAGGVAWWWMTRWTQVRNLEALFGAAARALPEAAAELAAPGADAAEAIVAAVEAAAPDLPPEAVGGEAAPISPFLETAAAPEPEPEPVVEAAPPEPVAEPSAEATPKPRGRKPSPMNGLEDQA